MDVTKLYEFLGLGDIHGPTPPAFVLRAAVSSVEWPGFPPQAAVADEVPWGVARHLGGPIPWPVVRRVILNLNKPPTPQKTVIAPRGSDIGKIPISSLRLGLVPMRFPE